MSTQTIDTARLWRILFLPFAAGYFLSYLFRTVNAIIGPVLMRELGVDDAALGLLTSTFFLAFAAAQLPLGVALDHFGPRRTECLLLLVAAAGCTCFALADGLTGLAIGRALIGLGVSACLMASFKAFMLWFPADRQASLTGAVMASGGLGALAATRPLEFALGLTGWREIFLGLAIATVVVSALIWFIAPEKPVASQHATLRQQFAGIGQIVKSRVFWRYTPIGLLYIGGFMALQGLWAARWMSSIEGLSRVAVADRLSVIGLAMLGGFLFMAFFATPLARRGIDSEKVYTLSMGISVAAVCGIVIWPEQVGTLGWALMGVGFSFSNQSYSLVSRSFPLALSGRVNTLYNLGIFCGAFGLQWGIGVLVSALQRSGYDEASAFRLVFMLLAGMLVATYAWYLGSRRWAEAPTAT